MPDIKCPVIGCKGSHTSSSRPNVFKHIQNLAKSELLANFLLGDIPTPHADYLKNNIDTVVKTQSIIKIGGKEIILTIKKEKI